ncbi:hypothetical protein [Yoonia vestfoldensis]|uniref:hypothetical protein n=1 Tax=Yoonia vestfoldensis TaxID=245188 RepID=UPI00037A7896|nr:hypothetical protein [Yoonia vestfoldensis]
MTFPTKTFGACAAIALLSACGGGGGGGPQTVFTYQTFGNSAVAGESTLAGVGIVQGEGGVATNTVIEIGTLDRQSRQLTIGDVVIDGVFDENQRTWTDGTTFVSESRLFASDNFQFMIPVQVSGINGGSDAPYIIGVVSRTQDLPAGGTFIFAGRAQVSALLEGQEGRADRTGNMTLTSNFQTDLVDVTISGLDGGLSFDEVRLNGLNVTNTNGNATFSGGTITFRNGTEVVQPIRNDPRPSASGAFFGGDPSGPTEVGGVFTVIGENDINNIFGIFAGNRQTP